MNVRRIAIGLAVSNAALLLLLLAIRQLPACRWLAAMVEAHPPQPGDLVEVVVHPFDGVHEVVDRHDAHEALAPGHGQPPDPMLDHQRHGLLEWEPLAFAMVRNLW